MRRNHDLGYPEPVRGRAAVFEYPQGDRPGQRDLAVIWAGHPDLAHRVKSRTAASSADGASSCGRCPASLSTTSRAPGMALANASPCSGGEMRAAAPHTTSTGTRTELSWPSSEGSVMPCAV